MEDVIYGKNAVLEALESSQREINKILISNSIHTDGKIARIKELAQKNGIIFQYAEFNHQGVIAFTSPIKYT